MLFEVAVIIMEGISWELLVEVFLLWPSIDWDPIATIHSCEDLVVRAVATDAERLLLKLEL